MTSLRFFYPVLEALGDASFIRRSIALALRVLGVLVALGGLFILIAILKYGFQPDTTTEATLGGIVLCIALAAAFACVVQIHFHRAQSVDELGDSPFIVIPVVSILFRLAGEAYATTLFALGAGGCFFIWVAKNSPLLLLGQMRIILPAYAGENTFLGGVMFLVYMWLLAVAALVVFYFLSEAVLVAVDIAGNVRALAKAGAAPPAKTAMPAAAAATVSAPPVPARVQRPQDYCRTCNAVVPPGNTFCGNCGSRI